MFGFIGTLVLLTCSRLITNVIGDNDAIVAALLEEVLDLKQKVNDLESLVEDQECSCSLEGIHNVI